ncbi:MAG: hypothetical protein KKC84_00570 [Candidatus Omnitrophica bacterium]|nr:hypothetical protein [Candidatus Omnitrophota bacterium]
MEYALMIAIVIGAFAAMQLYLKRGMQARIKGGVDNVADAVLTQAAEDDTKGVTTDLFGTDTQYEPYYQGASTFTTTSSEGTSSGYSSEAGGASSLGDATSTRTGQSTTKSYKDAEEE